MIHSCLDAWPPQSASDSSIADWAESPLNRRLATGKLSFFSAPWANPKTLTSRTSDPAGREFWEACVPCSGPSSFADSAANDVDCWIPRKPVLRPRARSPSASCSIGSSPVVRGCSGAPGSSSRRSLVKSMGELVSIYLGPENAAPMIRNALGEPVAVNFDKLVLKGPKFPRSRARCAPAVPYARPTRDALSILCATDRSGGGGRLVSIAPMYPSCPRLPAISPATM